MIASERSVTMIKGHGHVFVFIYRQDQRSEILRRVGKFASNNEIQFDWQDAVTVARELRNVK